jgi:hypothetical protein
MVGRLKDMDGATRAAALAVTTTCDLHDGIEWTQGTPDLGKIHVHASLDHLSGNDATGLTEVQSFLDGSNQIEPMLGAHRRGEMDRRYIRRYTTQFFPEFTSMSGKIYDAQNLRSLDQAGYEPWPIIGFTRNG